MSTLPSLISSLCCSTSPMLNLQHDAPSHTPARTGIRCRFQSCIHLLHKTVSLHLESASSTDQNWADPAPASKRWTWKAPEQSIRSARIAPSYPARPKHSAPTQTEGVCSVASDPAVGGAYLGSSGGLLGASVTRVRPLSRQCVQTCSNSSKPPRSR